jgi:hypothetical protein
MRTKVRRVLYISCATANIKEKIGERNTVHVQGMRWLLVGTLEHSSLQQSGGLS